MKQYLDSIKPERKDFRAVWHMHGQLPRNASKQERAKRYRLAQTFKIIRLDEKGVRLPEYIVVNAYRRWNASLRRRHPDIDCPVWHRNSGSNPAIG
jgi:hypothetical protein